jgi:hypothetical protein
MKTMGWRLEAGGWGQRAMQLNLMTCERFMCALQFVLYRFRIHCLPAASSLQPPAWAHGVRP